MAKKAKKTEAVAVGKSERNESVSTEDIIAAYREVATEPVGKMSDLAEKLGMKIGSLQTRLQMIKKALKGMGATKEELKAMFPALRKNTKNRLVLADLLADFRGNSADED